MSFKIKKDSVNKKQVPFQGNKSIEELHENKLRYFERLQASLPNRLKALELIEKGKKIDERLCGVCLNFLQTKNTCNVCETKNTEKYKVNDLVAVLKKKVTEIEERKEENDYFLACHSILLEYHSLDTVFKFNANKTDNRRQDIIKEYYEIINEKYIENTKTSVSEYCQKCNAELSETDEKDLVCPECGVVVDVIIDGYSYKDYENYGFMSCTFDYKRINYFKEWLNNIQARGNVNISDELLNKIKLELHKERITDSSKINHKKLKVILKKLDESKLYEHIPAIISKIYGIKPLNIPEDITVKLKAMFLSIQGPFELLKGPNRKNFFSYPYVLYKFFEMLELDEYLCHFQLLKSREKLIKQDILWKKIVEHLAEIDRSVSWKFISSV